MRVMNGPLRTVASNETEREPVHPLQSSFRSIEFFEAERARLFGALIIMTGNRAEAEELLQDAFLKGMGAVGARRRHGRSRSVTSSGQR